MLLLLCTQKLNPRIGLKNKNKVEVFFIFYLTWQEWHGLLQTTRMTESQLNMDLF